MKIIRCRILCILLTMAMLVPAIAGVAGSVFPMADASTFFTVSEGAFFSAKGTTTEQGQAVYELAASQTTTSVASKIYDLIFRAQYRVTDFGGSYWCNSNRNGYITSVTDSVLGTVSWGWQGKGCFGYAMFASQYSRGSIGRNNIYILNQLPSGAELKNFLAAYADPGEHLHFYYGASYGEHSVVYLAGTADGFYFLSENGDSLDIRLYYASYDYFAGKLRRSGSESIRIYSTNKGKDTPSAGVVEEPINASKVSQITFNGHTYTFYTGIKSYEKAVEYAESAGGYLATITSTEEQSVVNSLLTGAKVPFAWIGLTASNGTYAWNTNEKLLYTNYYDNNTTGANGFIFTDNLLSGSLNGKWDTCADSYTIAGKTYSQESFGCIVEVGLAFPTPVIRVSEVMDDLNQYTVFDAGLNYKEAEEFCNSIGGHLVSISDAAELTVVLNLPKKNGCKFLLGATAKNGKWVWEDGTPLDSNLTLPAASANEHLVLVTDAEGQMFWSTTGANSLCGFICEINLVECMRGDVDMNGDISAADAREVLRCAVGLVSGSNLEILGDVDENLKVDSADARILLRASVGLEDLDTTNYVLINRNDSIL